ncbi:MAG: hypothetical protein B6D61_10355 [Bacteroidetes bacterium 4484_249]|nr:MAG: hypothetical protein B6D61_10355 [Bacteroidetes bacterium 4484_249]
MLIKNLSFLSVLLFLTTGLFAQEFLCNITVDSRQVQGTDKKVFETLQTELTEFINNRQWTGYDFKTNERIECNMVISVRNRPSTDRFEATLNIVASRPVFNTAYNSSLLNYIDKDFNFEYVEYQPMEYQENSYSSNLTSVVAFYLYMILGLDFDSFSPNGGTPFYEKAESVVNAAQNSPEKGWNSFEDQRNRYWLVENYLNKSYSGLRSFLYEYHRNGLDVMSEKADQGRAAILESLKFLKDVYDEQPGLFALQLMIDAKGDEIINIFSEGNPKEKSEAQNIMKEIDPSNASNYSKITQRN